MMERIVDIPDLSPADERFVDLPGVAWTRLSGLPANRFERAVRRPRLSRYRGALQAALAATRGSAVISHLPRMSAAVARALAIFGRDAPHLAFAFNFTRLPGGRDRDRLARGFAAIDQFAVFSTFERGLYSDHFGIEPGRIRPLIWTQAPPVVGDAPAGLPARPFVCAIGGEGRDFPTLLAALGRLPKGIDAAIVARPHSLAGQALPDHVRLFTNLPPATTWALAARSLGVLVPLAGPETCCGHVTLVGAKLLGLPLVTSFSEATRDYVEGRESIQVTSPGDAAALARAIAALAEDPARWRDAALRALPEERARHDRRLWADYVADFLERRGKIGRPAA